METPSKDLVKLAPDDVLDALSRVPEEEKWLLGRASAKTRAAYRLAVADFIHTMGIRDREQLRRVDHAAVALWRDRLAQRGAEPSTVRTKLSALSRLFAHLVDKRLCDVNPVREVERPKVNRRTVTTKHFSDKQARKLLDTPPADTVQGLRDRAILSVGLQVGARRAEIAGLRVRDFHMDAGYPALGYRKKGGQRHSLVIGAETAARIRAYLERAGHGDDQNGPLFRPVRVRRGEKERRSMRPRMVDRILRKYARQALGVTHGFSAHSMRATFITNALDHGAELEDVQDAVGHADPGTTRLYDKRGMRPERAAALFVKY